MLSTSPAQLLVVREGATASLECSATQGEPTPTLVWARSEGAGNRAANESSRSIKFHNYGLPFHCVYSK